MQAFELIYYGFLFFNNAYTIVSHTLIYTRTELSRYCVYYGLWASPKVAPRPKLPARRAGPGGPRPAGKIPIFRENSANLTHISSEISIFLIPIFLFIGINRENDDHTDVWGRQAPPIGKTSVCIKP